MTQLLPDNFSTSELSPLEANLVDSASPKNKLEAGDSNQFDEPKSFKNLLHKHRRQAQKKESKRQLKIRKIIMKSLIIMIAKEKRHNIKLHEISKFRNRYTKKGDSNQFVEEEGPNNLSYEQRQRIQITELKEQLKAREIVTKKLGEILAEEKKLNRKFRALSKFLKRCNKKKYIKNWSNTCRLK